VNPKVNWRPKKGDDWVPKVCPLTVNPGAEKALLYHDRLKDLRLKLRAELVRLPEDWVGHKSLKEVVKEVLKNPKKIGILGD